MRRWLLLLLLVVCLGGALGAGPYQPNWASLDTRPTPEWWFQGGKFGIFIHWGIFSVPAYSPVGHMAEWYVQYLLTGDDGNATREFHVKNYQNATYSSFGPMFKAELWDPAEWANLFKEAGAQFILFTSKHCDGWANFPSQSKFGYRSVDVGPNRDIVADIAAAVRAVGIRLGLYYCNIEWGNPLLPWNNRWHGSQPYTKEGPYVEQVLMPDWHYIVNTYKPDVLFADYTAALLNSSQARACEFLAWLYNDSPVKDTVMMDDRWGWDAACKHGDYKTCMDRYNPTGIPPYRWADAMTIGDSWGLNRMETSLNYKTSAQLIRYLTSNVALGGALILNVGPAADGTIIPIMQERLRDIGAWLKVNGEAIFPSKPVPGCTNYTTDVYFLRSVDESDLLFAILLKWPSDGMAVLGSPTMAAGSNVTMIGVEKTALPWKVDGGLLKVDLTALDIATLPSTLGWAFRLRTNPTAKPC